ncbi:metallothiol transferase FosB [Bacillus horti]|uniref:Metallothiol transferase n=1 Tax=Caldalkalibacillus horti TaxID=77523 RepID=A0ABT9W2S1_9BACI|nr:metallothiol transferase [Bacillus horti]
MNINHITFSVSDLERSIEFYKNVLGAKLLVHGTALAYFDLGGVWLALNVEKNIPRNDIHHSYTHMAFSATEAELEQLEQKLKSFKVDVLTGRSRDKREGLSLYFADPDGHKFEFHTGSLEKRIQFYKDQNRDMQFYE